MLLGVQRPGKGRTCDNTSGKLPRSQAPVGPVYVKEFQKPNSLSESMTKMQCRRRGCHTNLPICTALP